MSKRKLSLLLVDDNIPFVNRMVSLLSEVEDICDFHTAHNYDEAIFLLDKETDLVLLDIQMPGKNGMNILKQIKNSANNCEVVMLTNSTGDYYREQCRKLGVLFFLDKTNEFELVPGMIKEFAFQNNYKIGNYPDNTTRIPN